MPADFLEPLSGWTDRGDLRERGRRVRRYTFHPKMDGERLPARPATKKEARENGPHPVPPAETLRLSKSSGFVSEESWERRSTPDATAEPCDP